MPLNNAKKSKYAFKYLVHSVKPEPRYLGTLQVYRIEMDALQLENWLS